MPYTSHGHWYGPGEPTQPESTRKARCGGPRWCRVCWREAEFDETAPAAAEEG